MLLVLAFVYIFQRFSQSGAVPLALNFARETTIDSPLQQPCVCPSVRSIWDILWSCLVTIFACSWVSVHPNIPKKGLPWWKKYLRRLELMVWSILTPELIISWAMRQWTGARRLAKRYHENGWTKTHGYFIQMGGFVLHDSESKEPIEVLSPEHLEELVGAKRIDMPMVSEEDIQDRSKGDGLAKTLVIIQTTWFIIQCIARKAQGLAITQLELATLAFATLNSIMYFLWWNKPLDVESTVPVYLKLPPTEGDQEIGKDERQVESGVIRGDPGSVNNKPEMDPKRAASTTSLMANMNLAREAWWLFSHILYHWPFAGISAVMSRIADMLVTDTIDDGQTHVKTFYAHVRDESEVARGVVLTLLFIGSLFGANHCVGWHFFFPSLVEANIWRVSSTIITAVPVISILTACVAVFDEENMKLGISVICMLGVLVLLPFYILARLALLVEALISLRDLPQDALAVVKWTLFLPHI